jgi:uncharacterized protein (TIGR02147 family)
MHFYYQKILKEELMLRIDRNSHYSLRSFASALGLGSSALARVLSGKRSISIKVVDRILGYLELNANEQRLFLESVIEEKKSRGLKRVSPELKRRLESIAFDSATESHHGVGLDEFRIIADWYHYAILELTFAKKFQSDPKWIARNLGISQMEAKLAVERLLSLELLEYRNGVLKKTNWNLDTKDKTKTSLFHRKRQKQALEKSIHSLENDPIEERCHSSLTVCIDSKNLPIAKAKIQTAIWEIAQSLTPGTPERVYEVTINLFPIQKKENSYEK